jgi:hypothetical protein
VAGSQRWLSSGFRGPALKVAGWALWTVLLCLLLATVDVESSDPRLLREGFGVPCRTGKCAPAIEAQLRALDAEIDPDDQIIATNHWVVHYYLARVDAMLRERRTVDGFAPFAVEREEYLGIPLIDTRRELEALRDAPGRVWIIADPKYRTFSSPETRRFIERSFRIHDRVPGALTVFTSRERI